MNGNFFLKISSRRILNLLALSSWIAHIYGEFWIHSIHLLECGTLCLLTRFAEKYDNLEEPGNFKTFSKGTFCEVRECSIILWKFFVIQIIKFKKITFIKRNKFVSEYTRESLGTFF